MTDTVMLNKIIAVEKGSKNRSDKAKTETYHLAQKPAAFDGLTRTYQRHDEDGEVLPDENQVIQADSSKLIADFSNALIEFFDVTATKDWGNATAKADVVIGEGENTVVLIDSAPVPFLLFLEKQLIDLRTFISKLPTLSSTENWTWDANQGMYRSGESKTLRRNKVLKSKVVYEATVEHPAQVQTFTEDVPVGTWTAVKFSKALPVPVINQYLLRVDTLIKAVKFAREEANSTLVEQQKVGKSLLSYVFA